MREFIADIRLIASPFGGGWAIPQTGTGEIVGADVMGEPAFPTAPLGGERGWILEPADAADLCNAMLSDGATAETAGGRVLRESV